MENWYRDRLLGFPFLGWRKNYPWMIRFIAREKNMIRSKMICWISIRRATEFNRLINFFKDRQRVWIIDKSGEEAANVYSLFAWRRGGGKMKNHDRARLLVESYFALKNFLTTVGGWIGSLHPLASYFLRVMGDDFPEWIKTSLKGWS